jgi:hypothetical protein
MCLEMKPSWCRQVNWGNCGIPWVNCAVLCVKDYWKRQFWVLGYCLSKLRSLLSFSVTVKSLSSTESVWRPSVTQFCYLLLTVFPFWSCLPAAPPNYHQQFLERIDSLNLRRTVPNCPQLTPTIALYVVPTMFSYNTDQSSLCRFSDCVMMDWSHLT